MGGELTLDSVLGKGSCFSFELELPIVSESNVQADEQLGSHHFASHQIVGFEGPPRHVLVIDDIAQNRAFVVDLLSSIGFEVFEAVNGQAGLDLLNTVRPDVVLLDLIMPVMDGFTTAKTIRHDPQWQAFHDMVIIAMSASTLNQGKPQSLAAGCDAFLLKPIDTDELLQLLASVLNLEWQYAPETSDDDPLAPSILMNLANGHESNVTTTSRSQGSNQVQELIAPPRAILETLWQFAQIGDIGGILDVLDQMNDPELTPFASELRQLATNFRVKAIQEFLAAFPVDESRS